MFFTLSSGVSKKDAPDDLPMAKSRVCSEKDSCRRIPSREAFSCNAFKDMLAVLIERFQKRNAPKLGVCDVFPLPRDFPLLLFFHKQ